MGFIDLLVAIGTIIVGVGSVIGGIVAYKKLAPEKKNARDKGKDPQLVKAIKEARKLKSTISTNRQAFGIINEIVDSSSASRAIILSAHNGGGKPTSFKPFYSSALLENHQNLPGILKRWQNQILDDGYLKIIGELIENYKCKIITNNLPNGILKDLYRSQNIEQSMVWFIDYDPEKEVLIYLSVNFKHINTFNSVEKELFRFSVNELQYLFRNHRKVGR